MSYDRPEGRLAIRTPKENMAAAVRVLSARLRPLRDDAMYVDNYYGRKEGGGAMRAPLHFTSVEALVMEVSDVAQAVGYFKAKIEEAS